MRSRTGAYAGTTVLVWGEGGGVAFRVELARLAAALSLPFPAGEGRSRRKSER